MNIKIKIVISVKVKRNIAVFQASIVGGLNKHLMSPFTSSSPEKVGKPSKAWPAGRVCFERQDSLVLRDTKKHLSFSPAASCCSKLHILYIQPFLYPDKVYKVEPKDITQWVIPIETLVQHLSIKMQQSNFLCNSKRSVSIDSAEFRCLTRLTS